MSRAYLFPLPQLPIVVIPACPLDLYWRVEVIPWCGSHEIESRDGISGFLYKEARGTKEYIIIHYDHQTLPFDTAPLVTQITAYIKRAPCESREPRLLTRPMQNGVLIVSCRQNETTGSSHDLTAVKPSQA